MTLLMVTTLYGVYDMNMEQFKPIPGYGGRFEVSNLGTVRTQPYTDRAGARRRGHTITPRVAASGHHMVRLWDGERNFTTGAHRLLLTAWVGPCPEGYEACHKNGIPDDNRPDNLYWGTHSDNQRDAVIHGANWNTKKTHCARGHEYTPENTRITTGKRPQRQCRICTRKNVARNYEKNNPDVWHRKGDYCKRGHRFTDGNTYIDPRGARNCRTCMKARNAARH